MSHSKGEEGFSVIEVLVAFALMSLTLTALYRVMSTSFAGLGLARSRDAIVAHGLSELDMPRHYREAATDRSGRYPNGMVWRIWSEPVPVAVLAAPNQSRPRWVFFEATSSSGQPVIRLRTVTLQ